MAEKAKLSPEQLKDVDRYLGKLIHSKRGEDEVQICPTCKQPIVKEDGAAYRLLIVTGKNTGVYFSVREGKPIIVGRGSRCDIRLEDPLASRIHAELKGLSKFCVITDLNSANGTFVNGKRVQSKQLSNGDVIQIGSTRIIFGMDVERA